MNTKKNNTYGILSNGLTFIFVIVVGVVIFKVSHNLAEFEEGRRYLHNTAQSAFMNHQREVHKIIQHFNIEYSILAVTKEGRDIPEGKIATIYPEGDYVPELYSNKTRFVHDFLKKIVTNEASLFYAQFNRTPTEKEMYSLLGDMPYYAYLLALQKALYNMESFSDVTSNSRYIAEYNEKALERLWKKFKSRNAMMTTLLNKNPSQMTFTSVEIVN